MEPGRNEPCPCGSGKKHKKCCALFKRESGSSVPSAAQMNGLAALWSRGRHVELESETRQLLFKHPDLGALWKLLGAALWLQGKDALQPLARAAELGPEDAEAHSNLGNAYRAAGQLEAAVRSHRRAVSLSPHYAQAHNNLGSAMFDLGYLEEAAASFRQALAIRADFGLAHCNLANVLTLLNQLGEAEVSCRRALEIDPGLAGAMVQLGELYAAKGEFVAAEEMLKRAIESEPDMPEAWAGLTRWRRMTRVDSVWLAQAQRIIRRQPASQREVHLRYALGKYFDDIQEYDQAFTHYRRANELAAKHSGKYHRSDMARRIDLLTGMYDREWLGRAGEGSSSERPVFVIGMWRSGTTLVEQILASHPEVFGAGELSFWKKAASIHLGAAARNEGLPPPQAGTNSVRQMADDYLTVVRDVSANATRVVDKMCDNFLHLGLIHAALPKARFIHVLRNPMDSCLSMYFQHFKNAHPFANDLDDLANYYSQYLRIMEHWRRILPASVTLEVPYEGLVEQPEAWTRKMLEFVGLPWDALCVEFGRTERAVSTFSKWQVRQPIHKSSVERWRNYEKFIGPLRHLQATV